MHVIYLHHWHSVTETNVFDCCAVQWSEFITV